MWYNIFEMESKKESRISWQVEEYSHREKTPDWYWALGVIAVAGAVTAIIYHNILFAILIILSSLILGYYASRKPEIMDVSINEDGIRIRDYMYSFEKITGFAIEEHFMGNKLLIESSRAIVPILSIPLPENLDTEGLYELLITKIKEKPLSVPVSHRIIEHIGF
jgi:hypothetical protein